MYDRPRMPEGPAEAREDRSVKRDVLPQNYWCPRLKLRRKHTEANRNDSED